MNYGQKSIAKTALLAAALVISSIGFGQDGKPAEDVDIAESLDIEELGNDRYRIGGITVDKGNRSFTLGGKILHLDKPLEYVAVKTEGYKGYESLLELDTTATDFQLACILIGLDEDKSVKPRFQFDENEAQGQAVDIKLSWQDEGETIAVDAATALMAGDEVFDDQDWVYIGSRPSPEDGSLLAEMSGTLIGFVHDPFSVIEHRKGAGMGAYGSITGNADLLPAVGSSITLTISVIPD